MRNKKFLKFSLILIRENNWLNVTFKNTLLDIFLRTNFISKTTYLIFNVKTLYYPYLVNVLPLLNKKVSILAIKRYFALTGNATCHLFAKLSTRYYGIFGVI